MASDDDRKRLLIWISACALIVITIKISWYYLYLYYKKNRTSNRRASFPHRKPSKPSIDLSSTKTISTSRIEVGKKASNSQPSTKILNGSLAVKAHSGPTLFQLEQHFATSRSVIVLTDSLSTRCPPSARRARPSLSVMPKSYVPQDPPQMASATTLLLVWTRVETLR